MKKTITAKPKTEAKAKLISGVVVSNKMQKTLIVKIDRFIKHPRYGKYYTVSKKFKVHADDAANIMPGTAVKIKACRPISKDKSYIVATA